MSLLMKMSWGVLLAAGLSLGSVSGRAQSATLVPDLKGDHPRLLASAEDFERLGERREVDPVLDRLLNDLETRAEGYLDQPLLKREQVGRRILKISRKALGRISVLSLAYHSTGDGRFARRARAEMLNVAAFSDWNPSHYLDVAEMAAAVAIGYDWLHAELDEDTRKTLRQALLDKALRVDKSRWQWDWMQAEHNWNSVCYAGMAMGALAIAEHEPEVWTRWRESILQNNPRALRSYGPDGVYPEGPGYWSYGTTFQTLLIETLRSAVGEDLGLADAPGLIESGAFMTHARGPSGRMFNFADGSESVNFTPAFLWTAAAADRPDWLTHWRQNDWDDLAEGQGRFAVFTALWWLGQERAAQATVPPRSWIGRGPNPVAFFRESWDEPGAMWLAVKGGRADLNHGHMDAGSFVFEADGVRWAIDPGGVSYHGLESAGVDLWNSGQASTRWQVHAYRNEAHNTLSINGVAHRVEATATLGSFRPLTLDSDRAVVVADMAQVLGEPVSKAARRFTFEAGDQRQVVVEDRLIASPGTEVVWTMLTEAEASADEGGRMVGLEQSGRQLKIEAIGDDAGRWEVAPYRVPDGRFGPAQPGWTQLRWVTRTDQTGRLGLQMTLTPK